MPTKFRVQGLMFFGSLSSSRRKRADMSGCKRFSVASKVRSTVRLAAKNISGARLQQRESHLFLGVNETRPGIYIFNDRDGWHWYRTGRGLCSLSCDDCCQHQCFRSRNHRCGIKNAASNRCPTVWKRVRLIRRFRSTTRTLSEEHGHLNISRSMQIPRWSATHTYPKSVQHR